MTWSVTLHPALTGDVAGLAPSEKSALILDLLQLEQDGGRYFPGLPYPAVMPRADIWSYRFYTLPESGGVMALQGSWVDHDICVLGLSKQFATENAYDE